MISRNFAVRLPLLLLALAIGLGVVAGESALYSALTGQSWELSSNLDLWRVAIVASPFTVLALLPVRRVVPWAMAVAVTLLLWGWFLYDTVDYFAHPDGSGANIGAGILMFAVPFVISIIAAADHFAREGPASRS